MLAAAEHLANHIHEAPVWIVPWHVVTVTSPLMSDCLSKRGARRGDHTACRNKDRLILEQLCDLLRNSFGKLQVVVTGRSQLVGNDGQ